MNCILILPLGSEERKGKLAWSGLAALWQELPHRRCYLGGMPETHFRRAGLPPCTRGVSIKPASADGPGWALAFAFLIPFLCLTLSAPSTLQKKNPQCHLEHSLTLKQSDSLSLIPCHSHHLPNLVVASLCPCPLLKGSNHLPGDPRM